MSSSVASKGILWAFSVMILTGGLSLSWVPEGPGNVKSSGTLISIGLVATTSLSSEEDSGLITLLGQVAVLPAWCSVSSTWGYAGIVPSQLSELLPLSQDCTVSVLIVLHSLYILRTPLCVRLGC